MQQTSKQKSRLKTFEAFLLLIKLFVKTFVKEAKKKNSTNKSSPLTIFIHNQND